MRRAPASTLFWIDETYIGYVDEHESLEGFAVDRPMLLYVGRCRKHMHSADCGWAIYAPMQQLLNR